MADDNSTQQTPAVAPAADPSAVRTPPATPPPAGLLSHLASYLGIDPDAVQTAAKAFYEHPVQAAEEVGSQVIPSAVASAKASAKGIVADVTDPEKRLQLVTGMVQPGESFGPEGGAVDSEFESAARRVAEKLHEHFKKTTGSGIPEEESTFRAPKPTPKEPEPEAAPQEPKPETPEYFVKAGRESAKILQSLGYTNQQITNFNITEQSQIINGKIPASEWKGITPHPENEPAEPVVAPATTEEANAHTAPKDNAAPHITFEEAGGAEVAPPRDAETSVRVADLKRMVDSPNTIESKNAQALLKESYGIDAEPGVGATVNPEDASRPLGPVEHGMSDAERAMRIEDLQNIAKSPNTREASAAQKILQSSYGIGEDGEPTGEGSAIEPQFKQTLASRGQLPDQTVNLSPAGSTYVGHQLEARNAMTGRIQNAYTDAVGTTTGSDLLPIPKRLLDPGQTPEATISHEIGHALELDRLGEKWGTGIEDHPLEIMSHLHPEAGATAAVTVPWDKVPGTTLKSNGNYEFTGSALKTAVPDLLRLYASGSVFANLTHGSPVNAGTTGDFEEATRLVRSAGFTEDEAKDMLAATQKELHQQWNNPDILNLIRGAAAGREEGLSKTLHMSSERLQNIRDRVRQIRQEAPSGQETSNTPASAGAGSAIAATAGQPGGAGLSTEGNLREGNGEAVSPSKTVKTGSPIQNFFTDVGGHAAANINKRGIAGVELAERNGRIRVKDLNVPDQYKGQGHASGVLKGLTSAADKHGVTLELTASPFGNEATRLNSDELKAFYQRHGFVNEPGYDPALGYMIREPKTEAVSPVAESRGRKDVERVEARNKAVAEGGLIKQGTAEEGPYYVDPRTPELAPDETLADRAVKKYGVTDNPTKMGFILPDGRGLDFSEGRPARTLDHGDVSSILPRKGDNAVAYNENPREVFADRTGAARILIHRDGVNIVLPESGMTSEQSDVILRAAEKHPGDVTIDIRVKGKIGSASGPVEDAEGLDRLVRDAKKDARTPGAGTVSVRPNLETKPTEPVSALDAQLAAHNATGGSTFTPEGENLAGKDLYMVGVRGHGEVVDTLTPEVLANFKADHAEALAQPGHTIGTWKNPEDGKTYLDVSKAYGDRDDAIKAGKADNQISIFHLKSGETIPTGGTGVFEPGKVMQSTPGSDISTRYPTAVKATEDPMTHGLTLDRDQIFRNPKLLAKYAEKVKTYPGFTSAAKDDAGVVNDFISHVGDNIKWLYQQVPPDQQVANREWYDGAHQLTKDLAEQHGYTHMQTAGVTAALSPQKDWDMNVSLAGRLTDIVKNRQKTVTTPEMLAKGRSIISSTREVNPTANAGMKRIINKLKDKALSDLTDPGQRALWVRLYDETYNPRTYDKIGPDGKSLGPSTNLSGSPSAVAWGDLGSIAKAMNILDDGSRENISRAMGKAHKVRSFYNNIIEPNSPKGHVTVDTHAVAAGLLRPLSGNNKEVINNFQSPSSSFEGLKGMYPLYHAAYTAAAKDLGIAYPRQLQSVVWEKIRNLFPAEFKTPENQEAIDSIWKEHDNGKITADQARQRILKYAESHRPSDGGERDSTDQGQLFTGGVPGAPTEGDRPGSGRGDAGTVSPESEREIDEGDTSFNFGHNTPEPPQPAGRSKRGPVHALDLINALSGLKKKP